MADWTVYIVESERGTLYTGITTSLARRLAEHGAAGGRGARFFRLARPKRLVYSEAARDRRDALKREA
jgi:putative endonuclease